MRDERTSSGLDPTSRLRGLARVVGVVAVYVGAAVIGFNPTFDPVLLSFPLAGHGVHVTDVLGLVGDDDRDRLAPEASSRDRLRSARGRPNSPRGHASVSRGVCFTLGS